MDADGQIVQFVAAAPLIIILAGGIAVGLAMPQTRQATEDLLATAYNNASYNISSILVYPDSRGNYRRLGGYPAGIVSCHQQIHFAGHRSNRRGSNRDKHTRRRSDDPEKGDKYRRPPRKKPPGWKKPWPPK